jgi:protein-tyrosine-phosphatase
MLAKDHATPLARPQKVDAPDLPWLDSAAAEPRPTVLAANNAAPPALQKKDTPDLNLLNLEVAALETLGQFKLTRSQLERLAKLAPATAHKAPPSRPTKVSAEYQKTLKDLRQALLGEDEERIADLTLTLDELREKEDPDFTEVEITDAARRHTAEVLRSLSAGQVVGFLADFAEEFPDPYEKLTDAFEDVRKLPDEEWAELRDEVAGQVGWLAAGLDSATEGKVRERVKDLLNRVHRLKEEEYTAKQAELEKAAKNILSNVGPTEVIRHFTERSLAELLSNPRLSVALEARLKKLE